MLRGFRLQAFSVSGSCRASRRPQYRCYLMHPCIRNPASAPQSPQKTPAHRSTENTFDVTRIAAVGLHEERQRLGHTDGVGQPSETRGLGFPFQQGSTRSRISCFLCPDQTHSSSSNILCAAAPGAEWLNEAASAQPAADHRLGLGRRMACGGVPRPLWKSLWSFC